MKNYGKEERIFIRIQKHRKENWKKLCSKKGISLSSLLIDSVESRIFDDERRKVLAFIEKQENFLQRLKPISIRCQKIANAQKFISIEALKAF